MNKKKYILVVVIILGVFSLVLLNNKLDNKETKLDEVKLKENKASKKSFAIMIQKEDGSGYDIYEEATWPTEGYVFNSELSGCIDNYGSTIENSMTYDNTTNRITIDTGVTSSCYVYFDISNPIPLGEYLISNSISGLQKTIITGDDLYRFSGTNGNTGINNYICLGTTSKCENLSENMYRIIGVEPDTGNVKVIKQTKYRESLAWHSSNENTSWLESSLYTNTVKKLYDNLPFNSMIVTNQIWNVGTAGNTSIKTRESVIDYENNATGIANIGILSLSDYYLAYNEDGGFNLTNNWIGGYLNGNNSESELTMTYFGIYMTIYRAWCISSEGGTGGYCNITVPFAIRPTFYLKSTVNRVSGSGTSDDPFIVQ